MKIDCGRAGELEAVKIRLDSPHLTGESVSDGLR